MIAHRRHIDFVFGLAGNAVLLRQAAPGMQEARGLYQQRIALAQVHGTRPPASTRLYEEVFYGAASWSQPWRVIVKAEVMAAGDNPRFVVTSLAAPTPQQVYEDLYCARGNCENDIKAVKCDLHSWLGKEVISLSPPPRRTVRTSHPVHGSSNLRTPRGALML